EHDDGGDVAIARAARFVRAEAANDTEALTLGINLGQFEAGGPAMSKIVADLADQIDVGVDIRAQESHAIGKMGARAERLERPAHAHELVDDLRLVDKGGAK